MAAVVKLEKLKPYKASINLIISALNNKLTKIITYRTLSDHQNLQTFLSLSSFSSLSLFLNLTSLSTLCKCRIKSTPSKFKIEKRSGARDLRQRPTEKLTASDGIQRVSVGIFNETWFCRKSHRKFEFPSGPACFPIGPSDISRRLSNALLFPSEFGSVFVVLVGVEFQF